MPILSARQTDPTRWDRKKMWEELKKSREKDPESLVAQSIMR